MPKLKTEFELETYLGNITLSGATIKIIGKEPENTPYVSIELPPHMGTLFIKDKDLKLFAKNLSKALNLQKHGKQR